jgi:hypothetical protein
MYLHVIRNRNGQFKACLNITNSDLFTFKLDLLEEEVAKDSHGRANGTKFRM